jgi:hypothetical protein
MSFFNKETVCMRVCASVSVYVWITFGNKIWRPKVSSTTIKCNEEHARVCDEATHFNSKYDKSPQRN